MMDLTGVEISPEEAELLKHPLIGGVILFSRNYENPDQLSDLIADIHAVREPRLLIAVDQEGGRVQRFRRGFTRLPPVALLGKLYDQDPKHALDMAEVTAWLMASELRVTGVDLSFAPVLDLAHGKSGVIGDRAFHRKPAVASALAFAYMRGMRMAGMVATGKHFPGHGNVAEDSHLTLPTDPRPLEKILATDLIPFQHMATNNIAAMMMAHVVYSAVDDQPASFSRYWVDDILRKRLNFQGAIFTDDLSMGGAKGVGDYADRARAALEAGCDMLPVCNHPEGVIQIIDEVGGYTNPAGQIRLAHLHGRGDMTVSTLYANPQWRAAVRAIQEYDEPSEPELDV